MLPRHQFHHVIPIPKTEKDTDHATKTFELIHTYNWLPSQGKSPTSEKRDLLLNLLSGQISDTLPPRAN